MHLDFTLQAVISFPNMEVACQIWKSSRFIFLNSLNQFAFNIYKTFFYFFYSM